MLNPLVNYGDKQITFSGIYSPPFTIMLESKIASKSIKRYIGNLGNPSNMIKIYLKNIYKSTTLFALNLY